VNGPNNGERRPDGSPDGDVRNVVDATMGPSVAAPSDRGRNTASSAITLAAVDAFRAGGTPVPLIPRTKRPIEQDWQRIVFADEATVVAVLSDTGLHASIGLGVRLGRGLADVDLDSPAARDAAPLLLPMTPARSGRASSPSSHHWYRLRDEAELYVKLSGPGGSTLVELRADRRHQTAIPPTIHPSGERYTWDAGTLADAPEVGADELLAAVASVGIVAALVDAWPGVGSRHDAYTALAGALLRGTHHEPGMVLATEAIVDTLARLTGDRDGAGARVAESVPTTLRRLDAGQATTGWTRLTSLLNAVDPADVIRCAQAAADTLRNALGIRVDLAIEVEPDDQFVDEMPVADTGGATGAPDPGDALARARARFTIVDRATLDTLPVPVEMIGRVLPGIGSLIVLTGARGLGKSLAILDMAGAVSSQTIGHWLDPAHPVNLHGPVVYLSGEGWATVPKRVRAWETYNGRRLDGVSWSPTGLDLKRPADARDLALIVADLGAVLVVVDSARAYGMGREDTEDTGALVKGIELVRDRTGASVLAAHNSGWDGSRGRGSTLLPDAADTVLHLEGRAAPSAIRTLSHQKHRDGDMLDPALRFRFEKVAGTDSGVLIPSTAPATPATTATTAAARQVSKQSTGEVARLILMDRISRMFEKLPATTAALGLSGRKIGDHLRALGVTFSDPNLRAALVALEQDGHLTPTPHKLVKPFTFATDDRTGVSS
jgi:hypothetical protein